MSSNPYASSIPLLPAGQSGAAPLPLPTFLGEISTFSTQLQAFTSAIDHVASLHNAALTSTEASETAYGNGASARLEAAVADCSRQAMELKDTLKYLEHDMLLTERAASQTGDMSSGKTKHGQVQKAKRDLKAALGDYERTEQSFRSRYRDLMARQYRIVNPQATDEEIESAVESGQTQVFSQALLSSNRNASANSVARAVRERQADIARIEKTLGELLVLFQQVEEQVVLSEPMLDHIDQKTHNAVNDLENANTQLDVANKNARSWRRNKWRCLWITLAIIAVIIIIIVIVVVLNNRKNNGGK